MVKWRDLTEWQKDAALTEPHYKPRLDAEGMLEKASARIGDLEDREQCLLDELRGARARIAALEAALRDLLDCQPKAVTNVAETWRIFNSRLAETGALIQARKVLDG